MTENDNETINELRITGEIIFAARRVETLLRQLGASDHAGIHAATDELHSIINEETQSKLHFIATIRNKTAHGDGTVLSPSEYERFQQNCQECIDILQNILAAQSASKSHISGNFSTTNTDNQLLTPAQILENSIRQDATTSKVKIYRFIALCGTFPITNSVYFILLLMRGLFAARIALVLLLFTLIAIPILVQGIIDKNDYYIYSSAFLLLGTYILGIVSVIRRKKKKQNYLSYCWAIPGLNIFYLLHLLFYTIDWIEIFFGLIPLLLGVLSIYLYQKGIVFKYAIIPLLLGYLIGLCSLLVRHRYFYNIAAPKRSSEEEQE